MQIVKDSKQYEIAQGHEWFWEKFADGSWEPSTFKIFDRFLNPNEIFVDIGAWIGPTTLYAADKAKQVFAFEPDPAAYGKLIQNIELNAIKNVVPYPIAVSDKWKGIDFGAKTAWGDSMSSELWGKKGSFQVPAASFQAIVADLGAKFIKIDIEGGEKHIFDGASLLLEAVEPTIHLSLHTPWFKDDLESFTKHITEGLSVYPYFYDENLERIDLKDAFDPYAFNAIVATYKEIT